MWDLSLLQVVPGIRIAAPRDARTLHAELSEAIDLNDRPSVIRFPKAELGPDIPAVDRIGGVDLLRQSRCPDGLVVSVGEMAPACLDLADWLRDAGGDVTVVDPRWVIPVAETLVELVAAHPAVVTVEDSGCSGSIGSAIGQALRRAGPAHTPAHVRHPAMLPDDGEAREPVAGPGPGRRRACRGDAPASGVCPGDALTCRHGQRPAPR
jgi:1-deoxy-D-xylulose-5-phosphate synthase